MTGEEFEAALGAYGSDFRRWPGELAESGRAYAAGDAVATAALAEAVKLDALLAETVSPLPIGSAAVGRIIAGISARHERTTAVRPTGRLFAWAGAAMAIFLVAGFVLGLALPAASDDDGYAALLFGADSGVSTGGIL
jgi:hypothetical protein